MSKSGSSFTTLRLTNPFDEQVTVKLPEEGDYEGVQVRFSPSEFEMKPNSSRLVTLRQSFPGEPIPQTFQAAIHQDDRDVDYLEIKTEI